MSFKRVGHFLSFIKISIFFLLDAFNNKIMSLNWLPMGVDRDLYGVHTTEFNITLNNLTKNYINGGPTGK